MSLCIAFLLAETVVNALQKTPHSCRIVMYRKFKHAQIEISNLLSALGNECRGPRFVLFGENETSSQKATQNEQCQTCAIQRAGPVNMFGMGQF
jgi:hypothetical protein